MRQPHTQNVAAPGVAPTARKQLTRWVAVDLAMMVLLLINLTLIVFEMLYRSDDVRAVLQAYLPRLTSTYHQAVHEHFVAIDLGFVAIYLLELAARWGVAVRHHLYERWYAYPLIHWYDVLGSIPVGSLRFLRILRVVSIVLRLQRLGLIDVRKTWLYSVLQRGKDIASEEVSDRVVVRVLNGIQGEIGAGTPVMERLWGEVIAPRKDVVLDAATAQITARLKEELQARRSDLQLYVDRIFADALKASQLVPMQAIPLLGHRMAREIEQIVRGVVRNVVCEVMAEVDKVDERLLRAVAQKVIAEALPRQDERITETVQLMVIESLEIIKDQVRVKQWRLEGEEAPTDVHHGALPSPPGERPGPAERPMGREGARRGWKAPDPVFR